jgi:hypothetical protein
MRIVLSFVFMAIWAISCLCWPVNSAGGLLEVLNPLGEINRPLTLGINPRIPDLNGKTIA